MSLVPGVRLGPYEVISLIGAGGMGEVYKGRDPRLGRDLAIKVLAPEFAADADRVRRFEQEARAASALNHPNILTIFDVGAHEGAPYLVTELLEGEVLRARLVVSQENQTDVMTLLAEVAAGTDPAVAERLSESLHTETKLRGKVVLQAPGSLPNDGKVIEDTRTLV